MKTSKKEAIEYAIKLTLGLSVIGITTVALVGPAYEIDNSTVRTGGTRLNQLVERKGEDRIRYISYSSKYDDLKSVVVNGKKYDKNDTLIFQEAETRYNYLQEQIDSINLAKKDSKLQKKLDKEKEEQENVLEILRK